MKIARDEISGITITEIMRELEADADKWEELSEIIDGHNLHGGDFLEALANDLEQGLDVDTDDFLHIC